MSAPPSIRELFEAALNIEPGARAAWLHEHCPDIEKRIAVERMLDVDHEDPPIAIDPARLAQIIGEDTAEFAWNPGHRIGGCELLRVLGDGGSSTVYLARRNIEGVDQEVALKLLHRGLHTPESQRQFRRERQVLARLSHPNIAHMLDGGVTDTGMPYLVIEYVDGLSITAHADREGLGLRERLRLMVAVARAVATAHRSLIVHRDIKPSNILVTADGSAKLLDFGIAKLLDEDFGEYATRTGFAPMTPRYAAPEQFSGGAISTATDVYALGVVLHELLLGDTPPSGDTRRPSLRAGTTTGRGIGTRLPLTRLRAALRGDLDNILMKALAEEPERRYAHAAEFAEDIEDHLASRPVRAHPPSAWYRTRKFVARHRGGVALTLVFAIGLIASLALALWQADIARREALRANAVRDFVVELFDSARARLPRDQRPTPEALVRQARLRLDDAPGLDAATRMDILRTLGEVLLSQSALGDAEAAFTEALALARGMSATHAAQDLMVLRADARQRSGRHSEALSLLDETVAAMRERGAELLPRALTISAAARLGLGEPEAALALQSEAVGLIEARRGINDIETLAARFERGTLLGRSQRHAESAAELRAAMAAWRDRYAVVDDRYVRALASLAAAAFALGELDDAAQRQRELLALKQRIYTEPHESIASTLRDLALTLVQGPHSEEAEAHLQRALAMLRAIHGGEHRDIVQTLDTLGALNARLRRFEQAEAFYREGIAACSRGDLREEVCARIRNNLGQTFYRQGRLDEAEREMQTALAMRRDLFGERHPTVAFSLATLANVHASRGDYALSVTLSDQALTLLEGLGLGASREAVLTRHGLAQALHFGDQYARALVEIDIALEQWLALEPLGHARRLMMLIERAQIQRGLDDLEGSWATIAKAQALGVPDSELSERSRELLKTLAAPQE